MGCRIDEDSAEMGEGGCNGASGGFISPHSPHSTCVSRKNEWCDQTVCDG